MLQPYAEPGSDTLFAWACKVPAHLIMTPEDNGCGFKGAAMYIDPWHHEPALTGPLRAWLRSNTSWHMRQDWPEENDTQFAVFWLMPALRQASADEIAADVLNDPALREALGFLASEEGQVIEDSVMQLWLPGWQAQLLTAGLTRAWQTVLDQNRPIWQRTEVLVGAGIGAVALLAWASRGKS